VKASLPLSLLLPLAISQGAVAQTSPRPGTSGSRPAEPIYSLQAEYRWLTLGLTNVPLDEQGTRLGQKLWNEQRLRLLGGISLPQSKLRFELGADLFHGILSGDVTSVGAGHLLYPRHHLDAFRRYELRRALLAWQSSVGELRVGHQTNDWGLGILANSGERELEFGEQRLGDLVERILFATRPAKNLHTALAFDVVYRDTNANLLDGDVGLNAVGSIFYRSARSFFGFFGTFRHNRDRDGDRVNVGALDLAGSYQKTYGKNLVVSLGFEALLLVGTTSRLRPDTHAEGVDVLAAGGVMRASFEHRPSRFGFTLEVGLASGDNDRGDTTQRALSFHPDYRVGLVLFPEVLAGMTARSADRLGDRSRVGTPLSGTENVPTQGSVTNAVYVWPRIHFRPLENLVLRLGLLYARAVADLVDPFLSFRAGGVNHNFFDASANRRDLGFEMQAGVGYTQTLIGQLVLHLGLEWGHLFPGSAFTDAAGSRMVDVDHFTGRVILSFKY
jgi:hypothetical protein